LWKINLTLMRRFIIAITVLVLPIYTIYGVENSTEGITINTVNVNTAKDVELTRNLTINGMSSLYTCVGYYHTNNLPADITNARWTVTDDSKLRIAEDNGVNGCHIERIAFNSYDTDTFSSIEIYPQGETELIFEFEWNGHPYTVSKTITFGATPRIEGIFELDANRKIERHSDMGYMLDQTASYYFVGNSEEHNSSDVHHQYEYRWKVSPQGIPAFPVKYFGKDTKPRPASFSEAGTYVLSLSITDGCGVSEKVRKPIVVTESNSYSITPDLFSNELRFTSQVNPARCKSGRGNVMFHDSRTGALIFQQTHDFCSSFSIPTHTIPNGLYIVRMVMNDKLIQQENVWVRHK